MPKEKREVTLKLSELEKDLLIYICHMTAKDKRSSLSKNIDKFNNLDNRRKQMLIDMQFNVRNFKNKNVFPLFKKALFAGDEEGMKKEYKRFFKSNGKTKSLARNEFFKKYFLDK